MPDPFVAEVGMLVRRPIGQVFRAIVDPELTTRFWFTKSSGRLEAGKRIRWEWEMYGQAADVDVDELVENERIRMRWRSADGSQEERAVDWTFVSLADPSTFLAVTESGFHGEPQTVVAQVAGAVGGFTLVLAGLKALLEHGIELDLIVDRFPDAAVD